jgi:hypothetical protein
MTLTVEIIFHEFEVATKLMAVVFCVIFAAMFWNRRRKAEMKETRFIFLGQGLFVLCFGITRLLFLIGDYFSPDAPPDLVFYVDPELYLLLWKISTFIGILAIIFLLIVIELYLVKITHYVLSIIASVGLIISVFSADVEFARLVTYITLPIAMGGVIGLYAYLFFKSDGDIRKKAALSLDGFILFGLGVILDTTFGKTLLKNWFGFVPGFIPVILMIIGLAIYTYFNIKE